MRQDPIGSRIPGWDVTYATMNPFLHPGNKENLNKRAVEERTHLDICNSAQSTHEALNMKCCTTAAAAAIAAIVTAASVGLPALPVLREGRRGFWWRNFDCALCLVEYDSVRRLPQKWPGWSFYGLISVWSVWWIEAVENSNVFCLAAAASSFELVVIWSLWWIDFFPGDDLRDSWDVSDWDCFLKKLLEFLWESWISSHLGISCVFSMDQLQAIKQG